MPATDLLMMATLVFGVVITVMIVAIGSAHKRRHKTARKTELRNHKRRLATAEHTHEHSMRVTELNHELNAIEAGIEDTDDDVEVEADEADEADDDGPSEATLETGTTGDRIETTDDNKPVVHIRADSKVILDPDRMSGPVLVIPDDEDSADGSEGVDSRQLPRCDSSW